MQRDVVGDDRGGVPLALQGQGQVVGALGLDLVRVGADLGQAAGEAAGSQIVDLLEPGQVELRLPLDAGHGRVDDVALLPPEGVEGGELAREELGHAAGDLGFDQVHGAAVGREREMVGGRLPAEAGERLLDLLRVVRLPVVAADADPVAFDPHRVAHLVELLEDAARVAGQPLERGRARVLGEEGPQAAQAPRGGLGGLEGGGERGDRLRVAGRRLEQDVLLLQAVLLAAGELEVAAHAQLLLAEGLERRPQLVALEVAEDLVPVLDLVDRPQGQREKRLQPVALAPTGDRGHDDVEVEVAEAARLLLRLGTGFGWEEEALEAVAHGRPARSGSGSAAAKTRRYASSP